jgi:CheY-like chemotaxis protein
MMQRKTQVLIQDENRQSRLALQENLEALGFVVGIVEDAANSTYPTSETAITFVNVNSETTDLLRNLRDRSSLLQRQATIAVLSPKDSNLREQCFAAGVADVLERPLTSDSLYECICSLSSPSYASSDFQETSSSSWHHVVDNQSQCIDLGPAMLA